MCMLCMCRYFIFKYLLSKPSGKCVRKIKFGLKFWLINRKLKNTIHSWAFNVHKKLWWRKCSKTVPCHYSYNISNNYMARKFWIIVFLAHSSHFLTLFTTTLRFHVVGRMEIDLWDFFIQYILNGKSENRTEFDLNIYLEDFSLRKIFVCFISLF